MDESVDQQTTPPDPRRVLAVLVRQQGRVRVSAKELEQAADGKVGLKPDAAGGWVLEWQAK